MAQAFFINPSKAKRKRPRRGKASRDATGVHTHWKPVSGHLRRVNPRKPYVSPFVRTASGAFKKRSAARKYSGAVRRARSAKRAARRRSRFSPAQLAAQRRFAAMARSGSFGRRKARKTRKARSVVAVFTSPRRTGGTMARRKRRRSAAGRKRRRRTVYAANPRRRRRRRSYRSNPVRSRRRRRRSYRRNPGVGISTRGVIGTITQGVKDGTAVALGSAVTTLVAQRIPFGQTSAIGRGAVKIIVGALLAPLVGKVTKSPRTASFFFAGAMSDVVRQALAPIPVIGPAATAPLGVYPRGVGAYPRAVGAYPRLNGWGSAPQGGALQFTRQQNNLPMRTAGASGLVTQAAY